LGVAFSDECERCGLSVNLVRGRTGGSANCVRMAPPLTITTDEIDLAVTIMDDALTSLR
jgi:2,2-dialkylglycine decarboxylase (pyruvate)